MMNTQLQKPVTDEDVTIITGLMRKIYESLIDLGQYVVKRVDETPQFIEKFCQKCPDISEGQLKKIEWVGRKKIHRDLYFLADKHPGAKRLTYMDFDSQVKYLSEPVKLLVETEAGWEALNVQVCNLTKEQSQQVFGPDGIRDEAGQRAWIESEREKKRQKATFQVPHGQRAWDVRGKKVVLRAGAEVEAKELAGILVEMKIDPKAKEIARTLIRMLE